MVTTLGERLRLLRKMHLKTQAEIGEIIGVSKTAISNYERNVTVPSTNNLVVLAKYFDVNVSYIIGDCPRMHEDGTPYQLTSDKN